MSESPEQAARRVFGARAAFYGASKCHTDPAVLGRVVELAAPQPDWTVLDVGTGTGHTAFALAPHVASVVAVDITPEMLAEAERLCAARNVDNVTFRLADAHAIPFDDGVFDLVTCRRAAHHFSNLLEALHEMRRALKPGGRLLIDDRSGPEDAAADAIMNRLDRYHDESHVRQYRPSRWRAMLEALGFAVEAVEPYVRHRPISALTGDVSEENIAAIYALLDSLTSDRRAIFDLREINGELHLNHWYVIITAHKA
ncbi:MAG: methyltransferase domain-containing protein [Anaerolineae bacterium]|nr:methyltransferase domain-containing protein [Anaerolineae bacterium]